MSKLEKIHAFCFYVADEYDLETAKNVQRELMKLLHVRVPKNSFPHEIAAPVAEAPKCAGNLKTTVTDLSIQMYWALRDCAATSVVSPKVLGVISKAGPTLYPNGFPLKSNKDGQ